MIKLKVQEDQLSLGRADRTAKIRRPEYDFWSRKEGDSPERLQSHTRYGDVAISNAIIAFCVYRRRFCFSCVLVLWQM